MWISTGVIWLVFCSGILGILFGNRELFLQLTPLNLLLCFVLLLINLNDFNKRLFRDVGDIFNRSNGQRQFYTMPVTESSNNQKDFANWLYNTGPSCKEGNGRKCHNNNPPRVQGSSSRYRHY